MGLTVPQVRIISKKYFKNLSFDDVEKLLKNKIHEYRLATLMILRFQYEKTDENIKQKIVDFYFKNTAYINNWDLVDLFCHYILGDWLIDEKKRYFIQAGKIKKFMGKKN